MMTQSPMIYCLKTSVYEQTSACIGNSTCETAEACVEGLGMFDDDSSGDSTRDNDSM